MKHITILVAALAFAFSCRAENSLLLAWTVENAHYDSSEGGESISFYYATVGKGNTSAWLLDVSNGDPAYVSSRSDDDTSLDGGTKGFAQSAVPGGVEPALSDMFYVSLWDENDNEIARSTFASYAELSAGGYFYNTATTKEPPASGWSANNFHAVPEPTSGLLLLLAFAGMALRRKRA